MTLGARAFASSFWGYYGTHYYPNNFGGLGFRVPIITPIMENQMEKKMENQMETGIIQGLFWDLGIRVRIQSL